MTKRFYVAATLLGLIYSYASAQTSAISYPKLSASTKQYLWKQENQKSTKAVASAGYVYMTDERHETYVSIMIQVQPGFNEAPFKSINAHIGTRAGNIYTVRVPVDRMKDLAQIKGIRYIDMDMPSSSLLDSARKATRVDSVQKGYGLPQPYDGTNVIMGVIDAGFDYTHPTFYDTTYSTFRIKHVWEEKTTTGTPPSGFGYGSEYTDSASIITKGHDVTSVFHGTHVAGIAAGSGYGSPLDNSRYRGFAYGSDIAMVAIYPDTLSWFSTGLTDIVDGLSYLYDYAASVHKPIVVNLSWGSQLGPHDGTSLFSQACNNLNGPGKIFVLAAGNNGTDTVHLQKTFSVADTMVSTFMTFSPYLDEKANWVDVWGDTTASFCVQLSLYNAGIKTDSSIFFCLDDTTHLIKLVGSDGDTCSITLTTASSEFNNEPRMILEVYSASNDSLCLTFKGNSGTINMWQEYIIKTEGYNGAFTSGGYPWATTGDSRITISDMATTSSIISAAAFCTKITYTAVNHLGYYFPGFILDSIAPFSSRGPTADGRTAPFIAAPGIALASSVSSVDSVFFPSGNEYTAVTTIYHSTLNGNNYPYALFAGTSMAAPCVSGIVALMLEVNPTLTPQEVKGILAKTAITDAFTDSIPAGGSNTWGFGKVNAYAAMKEVLRTLGVYNPSSSLSCILYPNPNKGKYAIDYVSEISEPLQLSVSDITGRQLIRQEWHVQPGNNHYEFDLSPYSSGIYFTFIEGKKGQETIKIVKQ